MLWPTTTTLQMQGDGRAAGALLTTAPTHRCVCMCVRVCVRVRAVRIVCLCA